ncbi:hypothetical protein SAMN05444722_0798 [Rhodovulum sp. ES.010]|uniref:hypothetical protein n=1 Tax=Rhodovulum sp. ES.010 TaxID=1882821 RepID=UPI000926297B|nr:hypothetical protein [Rhodovulum sp. ES.010]SIO19977.1 hypothetical protein SAMN05444722_0798 [Rhodovulum sp. ES.010]
MTMLSPLPVTPRGGPTQKAARDEVEIDVYHMTPAAIVRAELLAAVDDLMDTVRVRG